MSPSSTRAGLAHIAAVYGLDEADGVRALVMELVEGEDLAQRLWGLRVAQVVLLPWRNASVVVCICGHHCVCRPRRRMQ